MTTIPDFASIELGRPAAGTTGDDWAKAFGVSSLAAGHLTLVPALRSALAELGPDDVMVVVGGVIPPDGVPTLKEMGAAAVFLPGTVIAEAAQDLLRALSEPFGH